MRGRQGAHTRQMCSQRASFRAPSHTPAYRNADWQATAVYVPSTSDKLDHRQRKLAKIRVSK